MNHVRVICRYQQQISIFPWFWPMSMSNTLHPYKINFRSFFFFFSLWNGELDDITIFEFSCRNLIWWFYGFVCICLWNLEYSFRVLILFFVHFRSETQHPSPDFISNTSVLLYIFFSIYILAIILIFSLIWLLITIVVVFHFILLAFILLIFLFLFLLLLWLLMEQHNIYYILLGYRQCFTFIMFRQFRSSLVCEAKQMIFSLNWM